MGDFLTQYFPGLSIIPNVHPLVVHFPTVLLTFFLLLDVLGVIARNAALRRLAGRVLYVGTVFAALAVASGLYGALTVPHGSDVHSIMIDHRNHGFVVLGLAVLLSLWRLLGGERWSVLGTTLHLLVAFAMVAIMAQGADLGGVMVFGHGVGVHTQGQEQAHNHVHTHADGADHHHE